MTRRKGIIRAGAGLLWRRQRILWWLFAANLVIGLLAAAPVRTQLRILDTSGTAVDSLYHQMNLFRLVEALFRPEGLPPAFFNGSFVLVLCYFLLLLFALGGILDSLYTDRVPSVGDFLQVSAGFFWRMARLLVVFGIALIPILALHSSIGPLQDWIGNHSDSERLVFGVGLLAHLVLGLVVLAVRVWVDVAQIDCVADDRSAVRDSLRRARQLLRGNFLRLYASVLAIQFLLLATTLLLLWIWVKLPHEAIGLSFVLGEMIVLLWLGFRLWQKAVECAWYHERVSAEVAPLAVRVQAAEPLASSAAP